MHILWHSNVELVYQLFLMVKKMSKVRVEQIKSTIKRPENQKRTIKALGLGKINKSVEDTTDLKGFIKRVQITF